MSSTKIIRTLLMRGEMLSEGVFARDSFQRAVCPHSPSFYLSHLIHSHFVS